MEILFLLAKKNSCHQRASLWHCAFLRKPRSRFSHTASPTPWRKLQNFLPEKVLYFKHLCHVNNLILFWTRTTQGRLYEAHHLSLKEFLMSWQKICDGLPLIRESTCQSLLTVFSYFPPELNELQQKGVKSLKISGKKNVFSGAPKDFLRPIRERRAWKRKIRQKWGAKKSLREKKILHVSTGSVR